MGGGGDVHNAQNVEDKQRFTEKNGKWRDNNTAENRIMETVPRRLFIPALQ
jgi:hypothetical protein